MSVQVFEDSIDLHIQLLQPQPMPSWEASFAESRYAEYGQAFPQMQSTADFETRRFRTILLENDYIRLTFLPAMGGRLLSFFDKRAQIELLNDFSEIQIQPEKPFGLTQGIWGEHDFFERPNYLGPVDSLILPPDPPSDDSDQVSSDSAKVLFFECHSGTPYSLSMQYELGSDSATVRVEISIQNRSTQTQSFTPNVTAIYCSRIQQSGLMVRDPYGAFQEIRQSGNQQFLIRTHSVAMAPRQVESYAFELIPFFEVGIPTHSIGPVVGRISPDEIVLCASQPLLQQRLIVQTQSGTTYEMPLNLHPERTQKIPLQFDEPVVAAQIKDQTQNVTAYLSAAPTRQALPPLETPSYPDVPIWSNLEASQLENLTSNPVTRIGSLIEMAARAVEAQDFERADRIFEQALLYNGDDVLLWWAKAANRRSLGNQGENVELLNAHFLSPLEPMLRAEAFLATTEETVGKSPLLEPLDEVPELFIEVACQLLEARRYVDAGRWVEQALKHQPFSMLHYLAAFLYVTQSSMRIEAADHLRRARTASYPPYPYRPIEKRVLEVLESEFPNESFAWQSST